MGDGLWARKSGAAGCMERAALASRLPDALLSAPPALPTTATQALPIGWRDGVRRRRIGAARTLARAARQQLVAVLERPARLGERYCREALAPAPSSGDARRSSAHGHVGH